MEIKKELRQEYKERNGRLSREYIKETNKAITEVLLSSEQYRKAKTIFCYASVGSEVATDKIFEHALEDGKVICSPRIFPDGIMEARKLQQSEEDSLVAPKELDLIITPCISCDPYGNRLGRGMGYYDRYLKKIARSTVTIAVCRDRMLAMSLPRGKNDVPVRYCATESGMIECTDKK